MRRDDWVDFFYVEAHQLAIHDRLCNWARWVRPRYGTKQHPMWAKSQSNARQWHAPETSEPLDQLDGMAMEKAVAMLPQKHRDAIRWCYVWKTGPSRARRELGVTSDGLAQLVRDGRQMLMNRSDK